MYKNKINKYMNEHRDEFINDVMELIRIPSYKMKAEENAPFGIEIKKILQETTNKIESYGFQVFNYDNYVISADIGSGERQLDILAHLDVVPGGDGWTKTTPFNPVVEDGRIYGRGAADDKGPVVAALYAMRAIRELKIPLKKSVRLILGGDEENGWDDISYYYKKEQPAPMTFSPDADFPLINAEKGVLHGQFTARFETDRVSRKIISIESGQAINAVPGIAEACIQGIDEEECRQIINEISRENNISYEINMEDTNKKIINLIASGHSCHAAMPENGNNALTGLLQLLASISFDRSSAIQSICMLQKYFSHGKFLGESLGIKMKDIISGELTIALTQLKYKEESLDGTFDCRVPLCGTNENVRDVIYYKFKESGIVLNKRDIYPAHYVSEKSEFVQTLLKCYEDFSEKKGKAIISSGATYVHGIKNGVAFGCADKEVDNHMHGADEFIDIEQLIMSAKIFAQAIVSLCG